MKRILIFISIILGIVTIPYVIGILISKWELFAIITGLVKYIPTMVFYHYWLVGYVISLFTILIIELWLLCKDFH